MKIVSLVSFFPMFVFYRVLLLLLLFSFIPLIVKFLREVTPYFRKASIISEVGWELQRAFLCPLSTASTMINPNGSNMMSTSSKTLSPPSAPKSSPRADTRYIPLQLTHLARNLKYHDPGILLFFTMGLSTLNHYGDFYVYVYFHLQKTFLHLCT